MRERLMTSANAAIVDGHLVIRDQHGVIRYSANPSENPHRGGPYDVNGKRLAAIQRLIQHRYGSPCDCDGDTSIYLSAAFNAIALGQQLKRRKTHASQLIKWAAKWCPVADPDDVAALAARVVARPRRFRADALGKALFLSSSEHGALGIEAIYPCDDDTFAERKQAEKRERDRRVKEKKRREEGRKTLAAIMDNSEAEFCRRHRISARTLRYHKAMGPDAVSAFLSKRGIREKLPHGGASIDESNPLLERHGAATFDNRAGGGRQASKPATDLVIDIDPASLDAQLAAADDERRRAARRARAALVHRAATILSVSLVAGIGGDR